MAFMGRGGAPSFNNRGGNNKDNNDTNSDDDWTYDELYGPRYYYYVKIDSKYVAMEIIATLIIIITAIASYVFGYKSTITDPLKSIKDLFISVQLIIIFFISILTLISSFTSKSMEKLQQKLKIILIISVSFMLIFLGIKLKLDTTYNKSGFEQFYEEQNTSNDENKKSRIDANLLGVKLKTEKEYYIDECTKLYDIFKIKTAGICVIHLLINILILYQIVRISKRQMKKEKINKDDNVLFDDEQNVI